MKQRGFTLIEILIVVAIIGILSSVILIGLGSARARARDARRIADLREVQNALELYYSKVGRYPDASEAARWGPVTENGTLEKVLRDAGIGVSKIPNDPLGGNSTYYYLYNEFSGEYYLGANLEEDNLVLNDDVDGVSVGSFSCDDINRSTQRGYCVQSP